MYSGWWCGTVECTCHIGNLKSAPGLVYTCGDRAIIVTAKEITIYHCYFLLWHEFPSLLQYVCAVLLISIIQTRTRARHKGKSKHRQEKFNPVWQSLCKCLHMVIKAGNKLTHSSQQSESFSLLHLSCLICLSFLVWSASLPAFSLSLLTPPSASLSVSVNPFNPCKKGERTTHPWRSKSSNWR